MVNLLYLSGGVVTVFKFPDQERAFAWQDAIGSIKDEIAQINARWESSPLEIKDQVRRNKGYCLWLEQVSRVEAQYGRDMIPLDVRKSFENVKVNMEREAQEGL